MRFYGTISLALLIAASAGSAHSETITSQIFAAVSPSIIQIEALDAKGHVLAQGSGVMISKNMVISNCHVLEASGINSVSALYLKKRFPATLRYADLDRALCILIADGLTALSAKVATTALNLKVGDIVYAVGAPESEKATVSIGQISALQQIPGPGWFVIHMTAQLSPNSSGGGLFDSNGHLIGITSYYDKKGTQLNFAMPVTWINSLSEHGTTLDQLVKQMSDTDTEFHKGMQALLAGDYATAFAVLKPLAEQGSADAQFNLGLMYSNGWGAAKSSSKALFWYKKAAIQGSAEAQYVVGVEYAFGDGVQRDYTQAASWFLKAAEAGNVDAQREIGTAYVLGRGVTSDDVQAAKWFMLAASAGDASSGKVLISLEQEMMTPSQITKAQRLAREWQTAHHVK